MATQREMYHGNELYAWRESAANRTRAIDVDKWAQNQADILHLPGAQCEKKLSILDNVISPSSAFVRVDTEGGAPADDLTAITPGDLHAGMLLHLVAADSERVVNLRNSADATGIQTVDGKDVALDTQYGIVLRLVSTEALTYWEEIPGPLRAKKQPVASKDNPGLMQVGDNLDVTAQGVVDVPLASDSKKGVGRSATTAEVESGVTTENGPAWVTPERLKERLDAENNRHTPGDIAFKAQRYNELPSCWYFMNGTRYAVGTPQEKVLRNLSVKFKEDWGITTTDEGTNVPNWYHSDGRGPTMRAVNVAARQVGSIEEDAIQKITGSMSIESNAGTIRGGTGGSTDSSVSGAFTKGSARNGGKTNTQSGMGFDLVLDSSLSARSADETRMLNRGMTPAIFLGV